MAMKLPLPYRLGFCVTGCQPVMADRLSALWQAENAAVRRVDIRVDTAARASMPLAETLSAQRGITPPTRTEAVRRSDLSPIAQPQVP